MTVSLIVSLILTLMIETAFFFLVGKRNKKDLLLLVLVNILTNPAVVFLYWMAMLHTNLNRIIVIMHLELFAILTEGAYYKKYGQDFKRPYLFSIAANVFSYGTGVLLQYLL